MDGGGRWVGVGRGAGVSIWGWWSEAGGSTCFPLQAANCSMVRRSLTFMRIRHCLRPLPLYTDWLQHQALKCILQSRSFGTDCKCCAQLAAQPHQLTPAPPHCCFPCCSPQAYDDVSALVYTLRAVLGGGNLTTQPPNTELTALSCASTGECTPGATSGSDEPCDTDAMATGPASKGGSRGKGGVTL